jgi:hypothetical protein
VQPQEVLGLTQCFQQLLLLVADMEEVEAWQEITVDVGVGVVQTHQEHKKRGGQVLTAATEEQEKDHHQLLELVGVAGERVERVERLLILRLEMVGQVQHLLSQVLL